MNITMKNAGLLVFVYYSIFSITSIGLSRGFQIHPDGTYGPNTGRGSQMYPDGTLETTNWNGSTKAGDGLTIQDLSLKTS